MWLSSAVRLIPPCYKHLSGIAYWGGGTNILEGSPVLGGSIGTGISAVLNIKYQSLEICHIIICGTNNSIDLHITYV